MGKESSVLTVLLLILASTVVSAQGTEAKVEISLLGERTAFVLLENPEDRGSLCVVRVSLGLCYWFSVINLEILIQLLFTVELSIQSLMQLSSLLSVVF